MKHRAFNWGAPIIWLFIFGLLGSSIYFGYKYFSLQNNVSQSVPEKVAKEVIDEIGEFLVLPENEIPTIATVTNLDSLKDQPFFANAEIGDKVLIYTKSAKGILYRPSIKKIIEVAPINMNPGN